MKRVKEYLEEIKVPYTEENADGMIVLKLKYNGRTCLGRGNKT